MAKKRSELEKIIKSGRSVLVSANNGTSRVVTKLEDLPSDIELAGDDVMLKQAAIGDIDEQIAKLLAQKDAAQQAEQKVSGETSTDNGAGSDGSKDGDKTKK